MEIPSGFAQANLKFTGSSVPTGAEITLGLDIAGYAGTPTDAAGDVTDAWATAVMMQFYVPTCTLTGVLVKFGPNEDGPSAEIAVSRTGTDSGNGASPQVSALVQKRTAFGGRKNRGRFYLPGIAEGRLDQSGVFTSAFVDDLTDSLELFRTELIAASLDPVVLHAVPSADPIRPITALLPQSVAATQRRRQRR